MGACSGSKTKKKTPLPVVDPDLIQKEDERKLLTLEEEINRLYNDVQILQRQNRFDQANLKKQGINSNILPEIQYKLQQKQRLINAMKVKGYVNNQGQLAGGDVKDLSDVNRNATIIIENQQKANVLRDQVQDKMDQINDHNYERETEGMNALAKQVDEQNEKDKQPLQQQQTQPSQTQSNNNFQQPPNSQRVQQPPNPQQQFYQQPQQFGNQLNYQQPSPPMNFQPQNNFQNQMPQPYNGPAFQQQIASNTQPYPPMYYLPQNNYQNQMPQYYQGPGYQQQVASVTQ